MKISYATPDASPSYTVLGDESDRTATVELFAPAFAPLNQVTPLAGGSNTFKTPRGNPAVNISVAVSIPYASRAAALASINTLFGAFNGNKKHLKVEQDATVHYYPNALLTGYQPVLKGITVLHNLSFTTDALTTSAPTT